MFEEIYGLEEIIQMIALEKIFFDYEEDYTGGIIDGDKFMETALETVYEMCDHVEYLDYTDSILYFFSFPEMRRFYKLCKEHSSKNHIKFRRNPYVKNAIDFVDTNIRYSGMRNIAWNYWIPRRLIKKRQHQFLIETGVYFQEWIEMIAALFEIRQYFREKCEEIQLELYSPLTLVKPKATSTTNPVERKAA